MPITDGCHNILVIHTAKHCKDGKGNVHNSYILRTVELFKYVHVLIHSDVTSSFLYHELILNAQEMY